jgi:uncharacterized caspase-like protein
MDWRSIVAYFIIVLFGIQGQSIAKSISVDRSHYTFASLSTIPDDGNAPTSPITPPPSQGRTVFELRPPNLTGKTRLALVIGNSAYQNAPFLPNPEHDADLVARALLEANFTVTVGKNLDQKSVFDLIKDFTGKISEADAVLFYFSGHGIQVNGENFLIPVDAQIARQDDLLSQGFAASTLLHLFEAAETRIIILDACRDDPFSGSRRGVRSLGLAPIKLDTGGTFLAFSTGPGETALDGEGQNSPFAEAMAKSINTPGLEIEQMFRKIRRDVFISTHGQQRPWDQSSLLEPFFFVPALNGPSLSIEDRPPYSASSLVLASLGSGPIIANGEPAGEIDGSVPSGSFWDALKKGMNVLESANGNRIRVWWENYRLEFLPDPYPKSYAVISAIDTYDPRQNADGYQNLGFMVANARKLKDQLIRLGFPEKNIVELYDKDATRENIENALGEFWNGGSAENADRVVFYFGGHGDKIVSSDDEVGQRGVLVTYGFDKKKATRTGILLDDIIGREFQYTSSRQILVLLDACSSGLALPRFQEPEDASAMRIKRLSTISYEASKRSQAILVAGTGAEKALWVNGGIFTKSLLKALGGDADWNKDGIIMFDELAMQVREDVRLRASQRAGVEQVPAFFERGVGKFMFIAPP